MALTCPRCDTEVPAEAYYCPYCTLPRPKRGFAEAAEPKPPETEPAQEEEKPAVPFRKSQSVGSRTTRPHHSKKQRRLRLPIVSAAALVAFLGVGVYIFVVPLVHSEEAEPKVVLSALDKLRRMPSNEEGVTVDARMMREIERSRRVGNLVSYQGWTVQPVKGTNTSVLLVFSYQEVGDVQQRAEWLADLTNNTFTAQNELASAVYVSQ